MTMDYSQVLEYTTCMLVTATSLGMIAISIENHRSNKSLMRERQVYSTTFGEACEELSANARDTTRTLDELAERVTHMAKD